MTTDFAEVAQLLNERIEYLAHEIFGFPSHRSATELRFGESGAVSVVIAGDKLGNWYDFRSGKGGDGLELICEFRGLGRSDALKFGREWLSLDSANGSKPN